MGYNQYVNILLRAENFKIKIMDAKLNCGKFYQSGNKDKELSATDIKNIEIEAGIKPDTINSCGRDGASKGTEGLITILDAENDRILGTYKWDCPFWKSKNTSKWQRDKNFPQEDFDANYQVFLNPGKKSGGPIGKVELVIIKK